jgi:hypothetical protein
MVQNTTISPPETAWQRAQDSAEALLSMYFKASCVPFCFSGFWTDANALETLLNVKAEADIHLGQNSSFVILIQNVTAEIFGQQNTAPLLVAPPYFDDALWWGRA